MIYRTVKNHFVLVRHFISDTTKKTSEFLLWTVSYIQRFSSETWNFKCIVNCIGTDWLLLLRKITVKEALPELVEAGDLLRRDGPGLLVVLLREVEAILV